MRVDTDRAARRQSKALRSPLRSLSKERPGAHRAVFLKLVVRSFRATRTDTNVAVPALAHHAKAAAAHGVGADAAKAQRTRCAEADREVYQLLKECASLLAAQVGTGVDACWHPRW